MFKRRKVEIAAVPPNLKLSPNTEVRIASTHTS
jgi:hypothetical protein